jgi:hypothetical protein
VYVCVCVCTCDEAYDCDKKKGTVEYTTLYPTTLHHTILHYTSLHYTISNITLHYTTPHYTSLYFNELHCSTSLHYTILHDTTRHHTILHTNLEQVAHSRGPHAHEHLDEIRAGNGVEGNVCFPSHSFREERFPWSVRVCVVSECVCVRGVIVCVGVRVRSE